MNRFRGERPPGMVGQHCNTWVAGCGEVVGEQGTARGWESEQGKLAACHGQGMTLPLFYFYFIHFLVILFLFLKFEYNNTSRMLML
jgi:hypothetical protein